MKALNHFSFANLGFIRITKVSLLKNYILLILQPQKVLPINRTIWESGLIERYHSGLVAQLDRAAAF